LLFGVISLLCLLLTLLYCFPLPLLLSRSVLLFFCYPAHPSFLLVVLFVALSLADSNQCNLPIRYLAWDLDTPPGTTAPSFGDSTGFTNDFHLNAAQIEELRLEALQFYHTQFGVPSSTAFVEGGFTIIPGVGTMAPLKFDAPWKLAAANPGLGCPRLLLSEIPLSFTPGTTFQYGGLYGAYAVANGHSLNVVPGDLLSFGLYKVAFDDFDRKKDGFQIDHVLKVRTIFPTRTDPDGFTAEKTTLEDLTPFDNWGTASVFTTIIGFLAPNNTIVGKLRSDWRFPGGIQIIAGVPSF